MVRKTNQGNGIEKASVKLKESYEEKTQISMTVLKIRKNSGRDWLGITLIRLVWLDASWNDDWR